MDTSTLDDNITIKLGNEPIVGVTHDKSLEVSNNWRNGNADETKGTVAFQSGLITGSQWDAMCKFIGWDIADSDCITWGNYAYTESKNYLQVYHSNNRGAGDWILSSNIMKNIGESYRFPTGIFETAEGRNTAQKNIYDVAGNVWELTTEIANYGENSAVFRGGDSVHAGDKEFATFRYNFFYIIEQNKETAIGLGFHIVLYVE